MRPVERGDCPVDAAGNPKVFAEYQDARGDLISRIGVYCSYCERRIEAGMAVEHIQPKALHPSALVDWENFLLSCVNCNSTKGKKDIGVDDCYYPHRDNTFRAFIYQNDGFIIPNPNLSKTEQEKAFVTIQLTGLDKTPLNDPEMRGRRWIVRRDVWSVATGAKSDLQVCNTPEMRNQIVRTAIGRGFWSIWMTVFADDSDMLRRLIEAFPGTATNCFDADYACVPRPGGAL